MNPRWVARGRRVMEALEALRIRLQPRIDAWLSKWQEVERADDKNFIADADYAILRQEPLRSKVLLRTVMIVAALFLMWSMVTEVDEVTRGEGKVITSRQLQVLQSMDGGIVSEILVREGDVVQPQQVLVKIDETRFVSSVRESRAQHLSLMAKAARLRALAEGGKFDLPAEVAKEDPRTADEERRLYEARVSELETTISIARQQLAQRQQELIEVRAKYDQAARSYELSARELSVTKPLIGSGAVSEVELLRLERDVARFRGERDMAAAQTTRIQAAISESNRKVQEVELNFRNETRKELGETMAKLNALTEGSVALSDKVKLSALRSPVKGTVKRLMVNTVGGVVQPGKDVVEVVPLEDNLLLEARILPKDIAFLRPGQKALVKFTAYDFSVYGGLEATVENIGADTVTDEKGNAFYIVRIRTLKAAIGENLPIIPGMVAEVDILTGRKSILAYMLKPVLRAKSYALTER